MNNNGKKIYILLFLWILPAGHLDVKSTSVGAQASAFVGGRLQLRVFNLQRFQTQRRTFWQGCQEAVITHNLGIGTDRATYT